MTREPGQRSRGKAEHPKNAAHSTWKVQLLLILALLAGVSPSGQAGVPVLHPRGGVLRIAVTGDTGKGSDAVGEGIRRVHAEKPLDAIVVVGDNFYPCGVTSEHDPRWSLVRGLTAIGVPVFPCPRQSRFLR